jgi:hypothetical protein
LTLALELPVAVAFGLRTRHALLAVVLINLLTNPLLNYASIVAQHFTGWADGSAASIAVILLVAESVVVIVEWRLLIWTIAEPSRRMLSLSLCMNGVSALAGIVFWLI